MLYLVWPAGLIFLLLSFDEQGKRDETPNQIQCSNNGYIGEFEYVDDHRSGKIVVELNGRLNKCGTFRIVVDTGKTYLLRVVNAAMSKTLYFGIARHNLTIVAMDGSRITKLFTTDYVELSIQQSVDCIFEANQQPDYYYMVAGTNVSQTHDTNKITTAIIEYQGYIGEFEYVDDHRSGKIVVELNGRLNKCGVISPRFDVGVKEI
uniref:Plastocyanin-like domain-containing protein n=1 Tax=Solanum tuberosum TaxID=4113 RepID=M1C413_SOLTU